MTAFKWSYVLVIIVSSMLVCIVLVTSVILAVILYAISIGSLHLHKTGFGTLLKPIFSASNLSVSGVLPS